MSNSLTLQLEELSDLKDAREDLQQELATAGSGLARLHWDAVRGAAEKALADRLRRLDPVECLGKAWSTASELRLLAESTLRTGDEAPLALAKHALSTELHPVITIECGPIHLPPVRLNLLLEAAVDCAILVVADGRLAALEGARLTASASLSFRKHVLRRIESETASIGGRYKFADGGIPIAV